MLAIMLVQIDVKNQAVKITVCSVSSEVHSALLILLRGISVPKKRENTTHHCSIQHHVLQLRIPLVEKWKIGL